MCCDIVYLRLSKSMFKSQYDKVTILPLLDCIAYRVTYNVDYTIIYFLIE